MAQMRYGCALVTVGAGLAVVFGLAFDDETGVALSIGTAVIGVGAALLPAGAAANASTRILQTLPQPATEEGAVVTTNALDAGALKADSTTLSGNVRRITPGLVLARFEYGEGDATATLTSFTPWESVTTGTDPVDVSREVSGLKASTTYAYPLIGLPAGAGSTGTTQTFTTPAA
jgi:hypothetical protein